jgi:transposase-like protein
VVAYFGEIDASGPCTRTLAMVVDFLSRGEESAERVARRHGVSRQWLYSAVARARRAMAPRRPGPARGARLRGQLEAENAYLRTSLHAALEKVEAAEEGARSAVVVDERRRRQLELACFGQHVSLRGTVDIVEVAFGKAHRPRLEELQVRMREHGIVARGLVDEAREQVLSAVTCVAADDVYFHGQDVKVMIEPESNAVLDAWHSEGLSGATWAKRLFEFPNLKLLVSDLGSDLRSAASLRGVAHQADYFHESRYLNDILDKCSKYEEARRREVPFKVEFAREGEEPDAPHPPRAASEADAAEAAFFKLMDAIDRVHAVYQPINRETGRLWTHKEGLAHLQRVIAELDSSRMASLRSAARHLNTHIARYLGHLVAFEDIDVKVKPGSTWSSRAVLNGLIRLGELDRRLEDPKAWNGYDEYLNHQRLRRELERRLQGNCENLPAVAEHLGRLLDRPKRSSSCVESVNSRLRVMQMTHRRVTDEMLALAVLRLNLTPRKSLRRARGRSPYESLGVNLGRKGQRWFDVLLDAEAALGLVA